MSERESQSIVEIGVAELLARVDDLRLAGWRIVQILCVSLPDGLEISYSFGKELQLLSLRILAGDETTVPSITTIYPAAFLYENEIRDLFGAKIERISADWMGKLYETATDKPFRRQSYSPESSEASRR